LTAKGAEFRALAKLIANWGIAHLPGIERKNAERL
jgi:hypothetical protein